MKVEARRIGVIAVGIGSVLAVAVPRKRRPTEVPVHEPERFVAQAEAA